MTTAYSGSQYVVQIVAGLGTGAVLFLLASGLSLIFGALRVVNFAHGSLFMLGAYFTVLLAPSIGFENGTFWIVVLLSGVMVSAVGAVIEIFFFRPIYSRSLLTQLIVTFAFVLIIAGIVRNFWGAEGEPTSAPPFLSGSVDLAGGQVPTYQFFYLALAGVVALALWLILYRTALGRTIRAAVSDPELLGLSGVNVRVLFTGVFVLAAFFAGVAGAVVTFQGFVRPDMAVDAVILAFVIVVIGGLGSLSGAFIAAFIVGVAQALGILWVPQASLAIVFAVLVAVLAVRPEGFRGVKVA